MTDVGESIARLARQTLRTCVRGMVLAVTAVAGLPLFVVSLACVLLLPVGLGVVLAPKSLLAVRRQAEGKRAHGPVQTAFRQCRGVDAADQRAQFGQRQTAGFARLGQQCQRQVRVVLDHLLGEADVHAQGDQPGLRSIVQVPFDPAQFRRRRVHRIPARLGQLAYPRGHLFPGRCQQRRSGDSVHSQQPRPRDDAGRQHAQEEHLRQETVGCGAVPCVQQSPGIVHQGQRAGDEQECGQQPEYHADRHVDQCPQQVPPGRRIAKDPLAAPEHPEQLVGRLS